MGIATRGVQQQVLHDRRTVHVLAFLDESQHLQVLHNRRRVDIVEHPGVVRVMGEVYNPGYVQYDRGRGLNNYIEAAGGFTLNARKKYITIIYPNGNVKVKDSFFPPRVKEGSIIIVHKAEDKLPFDGTAFLKETASIVASLATIFFIIESQSK